MTFWGDVNRRVAVAERREANTVWTATERRISDRRVTCPDCGYPETAFDHDGPGGVHSWVLWANEQAEMGWPERQPTEMSERLSAAA